MEKRIIARYAKVAYSRKSMANASMTVVET
jgi:hypothetical protein